MRRIDMAEMWDKNDPVAMELHDIASLIYGKDFYILFNSYIFAFNDSWKEKSDKKEAMLSKLTDRAGYIFDKYGELVIEDKVYGVAPLIESNGDKINGYLLIYDNKPTLTGVLSLLDQMVANGVVYLEDLYREHTEYYKVLTSNGNTYDVELEGDTLNFKGKRYFIVNDPMNGINSLVCTG